MIRTVGPCYKSDNELYPQWKSQHHIDFMDGQHRQTWSLWNNNEVLSFPEGKMVGRIMEDKIAFSLINQENNLCGLIFKRSKNTNRHQLLKLGWKPNSRATCSNRKSLISRKFVTGSDNSKEGVFCVGMLFFHQ